MKFIQIICLLTGLCVQTTALQAASIFDYSDEGAMLKRFRAFEAQHDIEVNQLERLGVFEEGGTQNAPQQAREISHSLIQNLVFHTGHIWDSPQEKQTKLFREYKDFYKAYCKKIRSSEVVSEDILHYMAIFSVLHTLVRQAS